MRKQLNRGVALVGVCALLLAGYVAAQAPDTTASYFEFGKVLALGKGSVDIQTFDERRQRFFKHSFAMSRETRADIVHVGDFVEVIYVPTATEWSLRRLIALNAGIPSAGPPSTATGATSSPSVTSHATTSLARPSAVSDAASTAAVKLPPGAVPATVRPETPVDLGIASQTKSATVLSVPLGAAEAISKVHTPVATQVPTDKPSEECNRSSADWPAQPLRLAVLDFRYPTEREEAHDIGTTGGGSGTAIADLVFGRLEDLPEFAVSRGDRRRLYRADFAGAARVGRQLGVDAVLAGTFTPVEETPSQPDEPAKAYELRAGVVDTCTGQLLLRLTSAICPGGVDPGPSAGPGACTRYSVSSTQAADPKAASGVYKPALDALLSPLEHNGPPPGVQGSAGVVLAVSGSTVTIKLRPNARLKAGDQIAVHAWGLVKDPSTYTLRNLNDEEIGRVTIDSVQDSTAVGSFQGEILPRRDDTAELLTP